MSGLNLRGVCLAVCASFERVVGAVERRGMPSQRRAVPLGMAHV